ncbi:hypothetical protein [Spirosoma sp.]|uniref:hypothetical protein n=1 Tax=Spirosoma sp. TaxID=1899569 RepID=UPI003B3AAABB
MKNLILFFFLLALTACQSTEPDSFSIDPHLNAYTDDAPLSRKLFCNSINCENPYSQEVYTYHPDGKMSRVDQFAQTASGKLDLVSYSDYAYNPAGQLVGKIRYHKYGSGAQWIAYDESEYIYTNGVLSLERNYFHQQSPKQRILTGHIEYEFKDGQKTGQRWYDAQQKLSYRVVYSYRNNTVIGETWFGITDNQIRRFEHRFAGNRRQISEYVPNTDEQISMVEKTYDAQGRLSSEETKVINPLLCLMQAGVTRYVY